MRNSKFIGCGVLCTTQISTCHTLDTILTVNLDATSKNRQNSSELRHWLDNPLPPNEAYSL